MKINRKFTAPLAAIAAVATVLAVSPAAAALRPQVEATAAAETLSTAQLVAMYEEERLAGDVYDMFANEYGVRIFTNIGHAEDVHQGAVASLLTSSGFDLSTLPTQPGDYSTDGYAVLYRELVAEGSAGLDSAYQAGVSIETRDISDLDRLLATTTDVGQTRVLTALRNGSEHHLAAFSGEQGTSGGPGTGPGRMAGNPDAQNGSDVCDGPGLSSGQDRPSMGHGHQSQGRGTGLGRGPSA